MQGYQVTFAEYHSVRWSELVEQRWITAEVERWQDGKVMARMLRPITMAAGLR